MRVSAERNILTVSCCCFREACLKGVRDPPLHAFWRHEWPKAGGRDRDAEGSLFTPPGTSGIEVRLALFHTFGVLPGRISLNRWVDACCARPAEVFGLPTKGRLQIGYDADIVLFDPTLELELSHETLHSNIDYSTYEGMTVRGLPVTTISRGEILVEDRELVAHPGRGRLAPRAIGSSSS